ncbi:DNA-binding transcriptional regulator DsdC [Vibrio panuliri]|uniref:Colanic acid biosynthesis glycosyltransferase WcaA n=1 Tax=Vibrio panuliri TaxID=1381081 RepID=A0A1Q9HE77_9VIBR|nr:DNA-binding transcriptional regulator DsdC [Vibrio panuliri]KAB1454798.1 DNA-binding transcriptional regulator DsdC [Vibrio panuliri]OLQ85544.1 colanic acid biosynthesis glycosyltransferase WcaA [Vibrio panuliri]OLQ88044.1 colanic acid biosynthesis glycosyltransferase WcaA [Vibrio panuliri]
MYTKDNIFARNQRINSFQLSKLHTFEVAARHCSFSLAAEELCMTPSAISHRINKLEDELGIALFVRSHRKITLTQEGERIYLALKRTLNELNQEVMDVRSGDISGELTIYSRPSFAQCWLVPRIYSFKQQYPLIELKILTGNENINFQGYGIDAAIYFDEHMPDKMWHKELMGERIVPVCTHHYAQQFDLIDNPTNLHHATLLHDNQAWDYNSHHDEWALWAQQHGIEDIDDIACISFDRSDLAVIAAMNNAGIAMGRLSLIKKRLLTGELITPFADTALTCAQKYYLVSANPTPSQKLQLFLGWLEEQIRISEPSTQ